jgi:purine-binding chemotaxis protein CheW
MDGGRIGMVVDAVTEVMQIGASEVTPPPPIVQGLAAEYITGLVGRSAKTIIVLNTGKLLASKEKLALAAALGDSR